MRHPITLATLLSGLLALTTAHADRALNFRVELSGAEEVPPVMTDTSGTAILHVDRARSEIDFSLDIRNAVGILGVAGAHLHCGFAGSNGPVTAFLAGAAPPAGFDGRVRVRATLTDASVLPTACGGNIAELVDAMLNGEIYINVHSIANPGGEVRGQIE